MDSGQPSGRRWYNAPSYIWASSEELGTWPRCPREEDEELRCLKKAEDACSSREHKVWRHSTFVCVKCVPTIAKAFIKLSALRSLHARGFKCSIWSSLAIWTWSFDPAASRPKNCSFNSIRRLKLIPGWGSGGLRILSVWCMCTISGHIWFIFWRYLTEVKLNELFVTDDKPEAGNN